jgi:hypothetical protein
MLSNCGVCTVARTACFFALIELTQILHQRQLSSKVLHRALRQQMPGERGRRTSNFSHGFVANVGSFGPYPCRETECHSLFHLALLPESQIVFFLPCFTLGRVRLTSVFPDVFGMSDLNATSLKTSMPPLPRRASTDSQSRLETGTPEISALAKSGWKVPSNSQKRGSPGAGSRCSPIKQRNLSTKD